jgi:hypothetical protein
MVFTERTIAATWFAALGIFALSVAATMWRRSLELQRARLADEHDLMRLDSDMG